MPSIKSTDTISRQIKMLQRIPVYPRGVNTEQLEEYLANEGHDISLRTIERDLNKLSPLFDLVTRETAERQQWAFSEESKGAWLPKMGTDEALSIALVEKHLAENLPKSLSISLTPIFRKAKDVLDKDNKFKNWLDKMAFVPPGIKIKTEQMDQDIIDTLHRALMEQKIVEIEYGNKVKAVKLLGAIIRDSKLVFVCNFVGYEDIRLILAHRVTSAKLTNDTFTTLFDINHYVKKQKQESLVSPEDINLQLQVKGYVRLMLSEASIGSNQNISIIDDRWSEVTTTIKHTKELEHFLKSHIQDIKIIEPVSLRERVITLVQKGLALNNEL